MATSGIGDAHKYASLFQSQASDYAAARPTYSPELYTAIMSYMDDHGYKSRETAADIACGSGQASLDLAKLFKNVIGIDASPSQVAEAPVAGNLRYALGTAEATGLPDASCDLVTVAQALHWFDLPAFYAEAARVLRPGGCLALWTYAAARLPRCGAADAALMRVFDTTLGPYWDDRRRLVDALYAGMEPAPPQWAHVQRHEMPLRATWRVEQTLRYVRSWSAYNEYLKRTGATRDGPDDPVMSLRAELHAALRSDGGATGDDVASLEVQWPLALILATKAA